jgi:hypothetical protein
MFVAGYASLYRVLYGGGVGFSFVFYMLFPSVLGRFVVMFFAL